VTGFSFADEPLAARFEQWCSSCDGVGDLPSEVWERWDHERVALAEMREGAVQEPVLQRLVEERLTAHADARPHEPRSRPCPDCAGRGSVPTPEGLELLAFLRRHLE
jgi:hypothetical protein